MKPAAARIADVCTTSTARRFRLTIVALDAPIPVSVRLRAALKALLRAYRLRCEAIEEVPE